MRCKGRDLAPAAQCVTAIRRAPSRCRWPKGWPRTSGKLFRGAARTVPSRRRSATPSSPNARPPTRSTDLPPDVRAPAGETASASSAPARWAAASPWPSSPPASRSRWSRCERRGARPRRGADPQANYERERQGAVRLTAGRRRGRAWGCLTPADWTSTKLRRERPRWSRPSSSSWRPKRRSSARSTAICQARRDPGIEHELSRHRRDRLAPRRGRSSVLGLHFFSPANVMKLLEDGARCRDGEAGGPGHRHGAGAQDARQGRRWSSGVCHGFIGNRMLEPASAAGRTP